MIVEQLFYCVLTSSCIHCVHILWPIFCITPQQLAKHWASFISILSTVKAAKIILHILYLMKYNHSHMTMTLLCCIESWYGRSHH